MVHAELQGLKIMVKVWFKNRRAKYRQQQQQKCGDASDEKEDENKKSDVDDETESQKVCLLAVVPAVVPAVEGKQETNFHFRV